MDAGHRSMDHPGHAAIMVVQRYFLDDAILVDCAQPAILRMGLLYGHHWRIDGPAHAGPYKHGFPITASSSFSWCISAEIIVEIVYMTVIEQFRPNWRSLASVLIITNLYWLFCAGVNHLIGSNYLYTQGKLPTPSLLDILGTVPVVPTFNGRVGHSVLPVVVPALCDQRLAKPSARYPAQYNKTASA